MVNAEVCKKSEASLKHLIHVWILSLAYYMANGLNFAFTTIKHI